MGFQFRNNASAVLGLAITDIGQTTITLASGGSNFPTAGFQLVIEDASGNYEICACTARVGDTLTVTRAQEGTTAQTFPAGARVELRLTQAVMENFAQRDGFSMTGDIDLAGNSLLNAVLDTPSIAGGTFLGTSLRAADNSPTNELAVPNGGGAPTVGGSPIWHAGNDGPGSGLHADLLDTYHASDFALAGHTHAADYAPISHTHPTSEITGTLPTTQLEGKVLRHNTETSGVIRIVTAAPVDADGANGDIWLVVSA